MIKDFLRTKYNHSRRMHRGESFLFDIKLRGWFILTNVNKKSINIFGLSEINLHKSMSLELVTVLRYDKISLKLTKTFWDNFLPIRTRIPGVFTYLAQHFYIVWKGFKKR